MEEQNTLPTWDAEQNNPELTSKLRAALRQVRDPEIGMDIIQLGLVRNVKMDGSETVIEMILTTPYCPYGPAIMESARIKAREVLDTEVKIEFGEEMWDMSMMEDSSGFDWGLR